MPSMDDALRERGGMHAWMKQGVDFLEAKREEEGTDEIKVVMTDKGGAPADWYKYGIIYRVLQKGHGLHYPMPDAKCKVHYEGKIFTGEPIVNGSTYGGEPVVMTPAHAAIEWEHPELIEEHHSSTTHPGESHRRIEGIFEALVHMKEGDEWEIYLSPDMGYHIPGVPKAGIPPASVTVFKLKLVEILPGSTVTHLEPHPTLGARHPTMDKNWKEKPENQGVNQHLHEL